MTNKLLKLSFTGYLHFVGNCYRFLTILLLFTFSSISAPSFGQKDSLKIAKNDDSQIVPRYPDQKLLEDFRSDNDYNYSNEPLPSENPVAKWLKWFFKKLSDLFSGGSFDSFWQYVIMAAGAGLLLFLLYKAKVLDYVFPSRKVTEASEYVVGQENIHEINFEEAVANALDRRDFRLAIRLQYLKILKLLSTKELINWRPNLTNQEYVQQLEKYPYHADFVQLTRYFEFAWYGDFQIDESGFKEMKEFSASFQKKIGL